MMLGALRGDRRDVIRRVIGVVLLVAATVVAAMSAAGLADADRLTTAVVSVLAGSAVTLGFAIGPPVTASIDPLDPRRFAVIGPEPRPLAGALILAGFLSVPVLVTLTLGVSLAVAWGAQGASAVASVASVVLGLTTCVLFARVSMALGALVQRPRQSRELVSVYLIAVLVVVVPIGVFLGSLEWRGAVPTQLASAAEILSWTPIGAAWAIGLAPTAGAAVGSLVVALATMAVLVLAWFALVRVLLTTTRRPAAVRERGGLGWFALLPGTPGGAVAARSLSYWLRDRRYIVNVVIVPIAAVVSTVPLLVAGVPFELAVLLPVPIMALFFGWLPHNDLAYDSTALWMHIASGVRGIPDRVGRLVPVLLIGIPILAVSLPLAIVAHGRWAVFPAMVGVCAALFLGGLGLSSISSVLAPYAVSRPGDSPFQQPQRTGSGGVVAQGLVMLGAMLTALPAGWLTWQAIGGATIDSVLALWVGVGAGAFVLVVGIGLGAVVYERRATRLMEFAEAT
ncbi:ABC-2 type transport system permease protein [Microbacterium enclense]|uniref:ABC-2 type transport system permease protein n=2 Tax=Microbacterium enclense TaxID=993073 RepID=A0A1G6HDR7_9MICO|nr:ABC-2 type transport system permease protein [Microbacterium enclense]